MTEKEATIFDSNADIEAVAIRYDTGSETWQLHAVGTWEECRQSCLRTKNKGCEDQMRVIRAVHGAMYFNGETDKVVIGPDGHGTVESADTADAKRYRWLRKRNTQLLRAIAYGSKAACQIDKGPDESDEEWTDRTIDAAMNDEP